MAISPEMVIVLLDRFPDFTEPVRGNDEIQVSLLHHILSAADYAEEDEEVIGKS
jgi:hypothetical protein